MENNELKMRYTGAAAGDRYLRARQSTPQWIAESKIMNRFLARFPSKTILDVPVGTGRFIPDYKFNGNRLIGLDTSPQMVSYAADLALKSSIDVERVEVGDIFNLNPRLHSADVGVCIRFLNWVDAEKARAALASLVAVTRQAIIFGIRTVDLDRLTPVQWQAAQRKLDEQKFAVQGRPTNYLHLKSDLNKWLVELNLTIEASARVHEGRNGVQLDIYIARKNHGS